MRKAWYILAVALALAVGVPEAHALLLEITATWTAPYDSENSDFNWSADSIVQVVLYDSHNTSYAPSTTAGDNFELYGNTTDTSEIGSTQVYLPDTTMDGNKIIYTGRVGEASTSGTTTTLTFRQWVEVSQLDRASYDSVYLRVFSATEWEQGEPIASAWAITAVNDLTFDGAGMGFTYFSSVSDIRTNYFEVIPEPGTLGLLAGGGWGLWALGLRGRRRREEKTGRGGKRGVEAR